MGEDKKQKKNMPLVSAIYDWFHSLIIAVAVVVIALTFFVRMVNVDGISMNDTLKHQDVLLLTNFMYTPQRGDIVVISHGAEYDAPIIKRVIAVAGDKLRIDFNTGEVKVNGEVLQEDYIKGHTFRSSEQPIKKIPDVIPEGKIFVMGDNREHSLDSRSEKIGLIDLDNVVGQARLVMLPFKHIKLLN